MDVQIASRLANRRREAGLSQEALAAKLGVSRQAVSKWERSEASPDTDNLIALAALYGVTLDKLLYGTDEQGSGSAEPEANTTEATDAEQGDDPDDAACKAADHTQNAADAASDTDDAADASSAASSKDHVSIGWDGIHVSKPGEEVHVSWDGIHVDDEAKNEHVHIGRRGLHAQDAKGHSVESDGAGGVIVDGEHFASWREAREARARPGQHEPVSAHVEPHPLRRVRGDRRGGDRPFHRHVAAVVAAAHDSHLPCPGPLDRPPLARAAHEALHRHGPARLGHLDVRHPHVAAAREHVAGSPTNARSHIISLTPRGRPRIIPCGNYSGSRPGQRRPHGSTQRRPHGPALSTPRRCAMSDGSSHSCQLILVHNMGMVCVLGKARTARR